MNFQKIKEFSRENYLSIVLGFLIVASAFSYVTRINTGHTYNQVVQTKLTENQTTESQMLTGQQEKEITKSTTHKVQKGDTLWGIAQKYFGSGYNYHDLVQANKIVNPNLLAIGQELTLPEKVKVYPMTVGRTSSSFTDESKELVQEYIVQKGDTLSQLALNYYQNANYWTKLQMYNKLGQPHRLKIGQKLLIPPLSALVE